jgi:hypothetical protein
MEMKIEKINISDIIEGFGKFAEMGYKATHIIFPKPEGEYLIIGEGKFLVREGVEMGTVFGMKIYVDKNAKNVYLVDFYNAIEPEPKQLTFEERVKERIEWKIKELEKLASTPPPEGYIVNYMGCSVAIANFKWLLKELEL